MANAEIVAYNIAVLITTLFLLEFSADKFIDHTAIVARRTGIPETIIGLLTAGGEWEEVGYTLPDARWFVSGLFDLLSQLAVVVASLARDRASLATGNVVGSAISNILGAFSLGLLFHKKGTPIKFDRSSRIYSLLLLLLITFVAPITYFSRKIIWLACGSILIAFFAVYVGSVGWAISRGRLIALEDSDDDNSDDESSDDGGSDGDSIINVAETIPVPSDEDRDAPNESPQPESNGLAVQISDPVPTAPPPTTRRKRDTLRYHISYLVLGFLAICLAGYVLSHAATTITDKFGISDVLFGVIILAIPTTLPEKFVAIISGHRGHAGILVANTAGSNIFLLSLCSGIIMLDKSGDFGRGNVKIPELGVLWGSTFAFTLTIWFGRKSCRWIGAAMLGGYVAFIVLEFTVIHSVARDD